MPSYRSKNLRSGDLAESLALVMLQSFALVAPVPRTEDVGTDAVVTLLRDYDGKRVIAEDSFFVQIKSERVTEVVYEGGEVNWLFALDLPLFYASIDRKSGTMRLFCAHELSEAYIMSHARQQVVIDPTKSASKSARPSCNGRSTTAPIPRWPRRSTASSRSMCGSRGRTSRHANSGLSPISDGRPISRWLRAR